MWQSNKALHGNDDKRVKNFGGIGVYAEGSSASKFYSRQEIKIYDQVDL